MENALIYLAGALVMGLGAVGAAIGVGIGLFLLFAVAGG